MSEPAKTGRLTALDQWRGIAILLMVLYHGGYDLVMIFGVSIPFFFSPPMVFLQSFIAGTFVLLSGIVCRFSRSNLKRGAIALGLGLCMTLATYLVMPDMLIAFGILHLLGSSMLIFTLARPLLDKIPWKAGFGVFFVLFLLTYSVPGGVLGLEYIWDMPLPSALYSSTQMFFLGFPNPGFYSSDYFPLIPWLFLFISGSYIGVYLKSGKGPAWLRNTRAPWLSAIGKRTILVYILHQPVLLAVLGLWFWVFG